MTIKKVKRASPGKISPQMIEAAEAIGNIADKRYEYEIAADIQISHRQMIRWKENPDFMAIINATLDATKSSLRLNAYKSLNRQTQAQNMVAVKEALDRTEGQTKQKHEHSGEVKVIFQNSNKILSEADKV